MNIELFVKTCFERHRIYLLKKYGCPKPWTEDKIFQNWAFCCSFRKLDKTSAWIIENIIKPNEDNPKLWKSIIVCRFLSRLEVLKELHEKDLLIDNFKELYYYLRQMQKDKRKIVTNAFICNSGIGEGEFIDKVSYLFLLLSRIKKAYDFDELLRYRFTNEYTFDKLKEFPGIGNFMAYQYICDFNYSERYANHKDEKTWTVLGLGAVRGINRLTGNKIRKKLPSGINSDILVQEIYKEWKVKICEYIYEEIKLTHDKIKEIEYIEIERECEPFLNIKLCDVQHWLCEYDKYCRGGSKKRRYHGSRD